MEELERMTNELNNESRKVGLTMNLSKTKVKTNTEDRECRLDGQLLERVDEYRYLGQTVSVEERMRREL